MWMKASSRQKAGANHIAFTETFKWIKLACKKGRKPEPRFLGENGVLVSSSIPKILLRQ